MYKTYSLKALFKEIKDLNKWKDIPCLWIRRLNVVQLAVLPKHI